jgi:riboflavin synthase alpha subunit
VLVEVFVSSIGEDGFVCVNGIELSVSEPEGVLVEVFISSIGGDVFVCVDGTKLSLSEPEGVLVEVLFAVIPTSDASILLDLLPPPPHPINNIIITHTRLLKVFIFFSPFYNMHYFIKNKK